MSVHIDSPKLSQAPILFSLIENARGNLEKWLPSIRELGTIPSLEYYLISNKHDDTYPAQNLFGVWYEQQLCGLISLHSGDEELKQAELSYWLGKSYTGKGIMTEACKLLLHRLFSATNLEQIKIRCHASNLKSQGIPLRLGFQLTDTHISTNPQYPHPTYVNTFMMHKQAWMKNHPYSFLFVNYPNIS
jgi:ribosomal-protein-serine acetyltransferase